MIDLVPAARTVLVRVDPRALTLAAARAWIAGATTDAASAAARAGLAVEVVLDIAYDGADLAETAELLGMSAPKSSPRRHAAAQWTVAFTGFAPGFGYLVSPDWPFDVPRLRSAAHARARAGPSGSRRASPAPTRARPRAAGG